MFLLLKGAVGNIMNEKSSDRHKFVMLCWDSLKNHTSICAFGGAEYSKTTTASFFSLLSVDDMRILFLVVFLAQIVLERTCTGGTMSTRK